MGVVNKLSEDFIGVVVLGFVNVVVRATEVRPELRPLPGGDGWGTAGAPEHTIRVGDSVAFRVKEAHHEGAYLTLVGSLKSPDTGAVAAVGEVAAGEVEEEKGAREKKKKDGKRKKEAAGEGTAAAAMGNGGAVAAAVEDGGKKKKRRKEEGDEGEKKGKKEKKEKKKRADK